MRRAILVSAIALGTACNSNESSTDSGSPRPDVGIMTLPDAGFADVGGQCVDTLVFADGDGDGYGTQSETAMQCLVPGQQAAGFSRQAGDCAPNDPISFPGSPGVCGDFVPDDCGSADQPCPTTQEAGLDDPAWDCSGTPPSNVYAYARFPSGEGHYRDGGCFMFYEGRKDEFYAKHTLVPVDQSASCLGRYGGCICPSTPSYDKRIMAYTLRGSVEDCPETQIRDHGGISDREAFDQPTSNACRKYLYAMHYFDLPRSFVASSLEHLELRLEGFPSVEVACAANPPNANLRFASLLVSPIERNPGFQKKQ